LTTEITPEDNMTDTDRPLRLAVLIGSTREGRAGAAIARWFVTHANQHAGFEVDVLDLLDVPLPPRLPENSTPEQEAWAARIDRADAFVVVTPEYNHSFPASLKQAIDCAYEEWFAKPVGFVSYGGVARGLRAVEQLRGVFSELHVVTQRDGVSIGLDDGVDDTGWVCDPAAGRAAKVLLDQLEWWGHALRTARAERPYVA
jgi:NAD(P)H-dependent FMN reductase